VVKSEAERGSEDGALRAAAAAAAVAASRFQSSYESVESAMGGPKAGTNSGTGFNIVTGKLTGSSIASYSEEQRVSTATIPEKARALYLKAEFWFALVEEVEDLKRP
jgi:hypothetical protein